MLKMVMMHRILVGTTRGNVTGMVKQLQTFLGRQASQLSCAGAWDTLVQFSKSIPAPRPWLLCMVSYHGQETPH